MQDESKHLNETQSIINKNSKQSLPVVSTSQQQLISSPQSTSNNLICSSILPNLNNENLMNNTPENCSKLGSKKSNDLIVAHDNFNYVQVN